MAAISTVIAAASLAVSAGSAIGSFMNGSAAADASNKQNHLNAEMEMAKADAESQTQVLRQQQMNLDAVRRKREVLRSSLAARSAALATTTAQGAANPGGSSFGGAAGSISGRLGVNTQGITTNQEIGNKIFGINRDLLQTYKQGASQGAQFSGELADAQSNQAMFSGIGNFSNSIATNANTIGKVATYASNQFGSDSSNSGVEPEAATGVGVYS